MYVVSCAGIANTVCVSEENIRKWIGFSLNPHSAVVFPYVMYSVCLERVQPFCMTDTGNAIKPSG